MITSTPESLAPGERRRVDVAVLFAEGGEGRSRLDAVARLRDISDAVQAAYDGGGLEALRGVTVSYGPVGVAPEPPAPGDLALTVRSTPSARPVAAFALPGETTVRLSVVDVLGRTVALLASGPHPAGAHEAAFPGALAAGVYVVVLEADGRRLARTVTVAR